MSFYDEVLDRTVEVMGTNERAVEWLEKMSATLQATPKVDCTGKSGGVL